MKIDDFKRSGKYETNKLNSIDKSKDQWKQYLKLDLKKLRLKGIQNAFRLNINDRFGKDIKSTERSK